MLFRQWCSGFHVCLAAGGSYLKGGNTKLNARLALRQRADLLVANISTNRISLPQGRNREDPGNEVAGDRGWSPRR